LILAFSIFFFFFFFALLLCVFSLSFARAFWM
jgi:hypothetical protein